VHGLLARRDLSVNRRGLPSRPLPAGRLAGCARREAPWRGRRRRPDS